MSDKQQFDLLTIGSGEAGRNLARAMAKAGRRTTVVERKLIRRRIRQCGGLGWFCWLASHTIQQPGCFRHRSFIAQDVPEI
jgi:flavin-dependent dehydrogenase